MKLEWDTIKPDGYKSRDVTQPDGTPKIVYTPLYSKQTQHRQYGRAMLKCMFPEGHIDPPHEDD